MKVAYNDFGEGPFAQWVYLVESHEKMEHGPLKAAAGAYSLRWLSAE